MEDVGRIDEVREELAVVTASLVGDTRPLSYPLTDGRIQFGLAPVAGPDHPVMNVDEAIRKVIFKTGILSTFFTL